MPVDTSLVIIGLQAGAAAGAAYPAADLIKTFVERLFGPSVDYAGQGLKNWLAKRTSRAGKVIADAAQMVHESGVTPQEVHGRILLPLIEYSSLEDEPDLQRKWASLLANAASSGKANRIIPAFAEILRQLTPVQARILDWMHSKEIDNTQYGLSKTWPDVTRSDIEKTFDLSHGDYALLITDMERLQLIEPRRDIPVMDDEGAAIDGEQILALAVARWNSRIKYDSIGFTSLGLHFIQACLPPNAADDK
jgi:hypothetical protein